MIDGITWSILVGGFRTTSVEHVASRLLAGSRRRPLPPRASPQERAPSGRHAWRSGGGPPIVRQTAARAAPTLRPARRRAPHGRRPRRSKSRYAGALTRTRSAPSTPAVQTAERSENSAPLDSPPASGVRGVAAGRIELDHERHRDDSGRPARVHHLEGARRLFDVDHHAGS